MICNAYTKLVSENNSAIKGLSGNEQNEINKNTEYIRAKGVGIYDSEMFRKDLISMYHERKLREESVEDMNTREFCEAVIENCPKRRYESVFYTLYQFSGIIFIWSVLDLLLYANPYSLHFATVFLYLLTIAFYFSIYYIFPRFTLPKYISGVFIILVVILALLGVFSWLPKTDSVTASSIWITIPSGIWFFSHLVLFIIMKIVWDCYINRLAENE